MVTLTINESAGTTALLIKQGTTAAWHIDIYTDETKTALADLSGYSARGQCRAEYDVTSPELMSIICTVSGGRVTCLIVPLNSAACLTLGGVFDVEIYDPMDDSIVYRIQQGTFTINPEVTIDAA